LLGSGLLKKADFNVLGSWRFKKNVGIVGTNNRIPVMYKPILLA
jgi:hypothetical protein